MAKKKENKKDFRIVICAIICLTILEIFAMFNGINGTFRTVIFTAIAGLAGWSLPQLKIRS
jgi:hypothetical protein